MTNSFESDDRTPASNVVLDASALLAVVLDEPGADVVRGYISDGAIIGAINLAEVISKLARDGFTDDEIRSALAPLTLRVAGLTETMAWNAGVLIRRTITHGLSLGDRCCLVLAAELGLPVITADRVWAELDVGVEILVCR